MKIRTQEELYDRIYDDLVWRRRELVLFNSQLDRVNSEFSRALLRGSVALLYAHWEGFIKNACHYYLCYLSTCDIPFSQLIPELAALALRGKISEAIFAKKIAMRAELVRHIRDRAQERARIPNSRDTVITESNLSYAVLTEILTSVGCDAERYADYADLIDDQLVNSRNKIAHGEYANIARTEWKELSSQVLWMMDDIATQLVNGAVERSYLTSSGLNG
ncbi:MAE_28990/MAE_18760 family HEPN-like nuclease [Mycobacterium marinum]|uniref:MAE_28990/MAE_18760 family HEPN-like nuclease n=1 Tax=Mycobacterium marinum TaxID=1781 RepID=UPI002358618A|nr:MAE_28990/MAE_18760 family HEPN-like nuclease [Mycobacterium marinum]WCS16764.1 MAE_28990/MAE_18760 family HEPN-like nuclease [Mycobacterium marinum]